MDSTLRHYSVLFLLCVGTSPTVVQGEFQLLSTVSNVCLGNKSNQESPAQLRSLHVCLLHGKIQDFWNGGHVHKGEGVRLADFFSFSLNIP